MIEDEVERVLMEMKNRKAVGIDELPAEVLKNLKTKGGKELVYPCNEIYEKGEWPNDFWQQ